MNSPTVVLYSVLSLTLALRTERLPNNTVFKTCIECVNHHKEWCNFGNECDVDWCPTEGSIKNELNCPKTIKKDARFQYDDEFVRKKILVATAAVNLENPQTCFDNQMPTMQLCQTYYINKTSPTDYTTFFAFTAVDLVEKAIILSFRGTQNNRQLVLELASFFSNRQRQFSKHGTIFAYFYDGLEAIWKKGMKSDVIQLKKKHRNFEVWVTGYSMGGALASVAASFLVEEKIFKPEIIKLVTMGQPRTGDYEYALWHEKTFPYSYRIVHNRDLIPHMPPQLGIGFSLYHHRTEIWYPNDMSAGSEYIECDEADGYYCSATLDFDFTLEDHGLYFIKEMAAWGWVGCPIEWDQ